MEKEDQMSMDYRDFVIKDGKFIGKFDEMYQSCEDPWMQDQVEAAHNHHKHLLVPLLRVLGIRPETMLDIGCGKGNFTHLYHVNLGLKKSYGVDISLKAIEIAQKGIE